MRLLTTPSTGDLALHHDRTPDAADPAAARPTAAGRLRRLRRLGSLCRAELLLLARNRTAVFSAVAMPLVLLGAVSGIETGTGELGRDGLLVTSLIGFVLLTAVYYNLVTTFVARREELVLKRLRVGELSDGEVLGGVASSAVVVALAQIALVVVVGTALNLPLPVNPLLLLAGVVGGIVAFVLLAAVTSACTGTTETAQVTALPVLLVCMVGSGLVVPLEVLPEPLTRVLGLLPMSAAMDLVRLGWVGTTGAGEPGSFVEVLGSGGVPAAILLGWVVCGVRVVRRGFRWEPRR